MMRKIKILIESGRKIGALPSRISRLAARPKVVALVVGLILLIYIVVNLYLTPIRLITLPVYLYFYILHVEKMEKEGVVTPLHLFSLSAYLFALSANYFPLEWEVSSRQ